MIAIPLEKDFKMTRGNYWLYVLGLIIGCFIIGYTTADQYGNIPDGVMVMVEGGSAIYMWTIGYQRLRDAGVKYTAWAFFAPSLIGLIWIGCISDRVPRVKMSEDLMMLKNQAE